MPQRHDNLEGVRLAIELLRRIPRRSKVSAAELQVALAAMGIVRDIRTIQRQLDMLSQHFDIERDDSGKPYGYRWKERAAGLSLPGMTEQEALLLTLAEQHLRNLLPANLLQSMAGFFQQARRSLGPPRSTAREREWLDKVRVVSTSLPLLPPRIQPGVMEEVSNALYADRWLSIDYGNAKGKRAQIEVMPLGLAQQGPSLYLVCRYRGYDNERTLALHRMRSAKASRESFVRPAGFSLEKYDDDGRFYLGHGRRIRLTFDIDRATGLHLLETRLSEDQQSEERDGVLRISATVVESEWLRHWIRGFGDAIRIVDTQAG